MSKLILIYLLFRLTGNPLVAILVLLVVLYFADRRFVGLLPSIVRPVQNRMRISQLKTTLRSNPNDTRAKVEIARLLLEKGQYEQARRYLEEAAKVMNDSADVRCDLGYSYLGLKQVERGEPLILEALAINPRVKYGEPYLKLAEAVSPLDKARAIDYLMKFKQEHSSSVQAYYRLGMLYRQLGQRSEAKSALAEARDIYHSLPRYLKRTERKWALLSWFKSIA